jgi:3-phenylpropionate/trans-cinnamate dioxygenase ferredoxin reductase component
MADVETRSTTFVIVGGGLAGAEAAATLRAEGFDGSVVVVAGESEYPYERPPLSKAYLAGESDFTAALVHEPSWYEAVDLRLGTEAVGLDVTAHELTLADGGTVGYDKLLIATGAIPSRLPVAGADRALTLRTKADADALRQRLVEGTSVVVVGGGWIGLEVAAAARGRGAQVCVVESGPAPLAGVLGEQVGQLFAQVHRDNAVRVLTSATVERIDGDGVVVDGETLAADVVVAGTGVDPVVDLAVDAGLDVGDGVVVDRSLRSSHPDVFAAGDVASAFYPRYGRHVRVEHWANAKHQGPAAARAMLGQDVTFDRLPYFFTDQYDLGMEYIGWVPPEMLGDATVVLRGDVAARQFRAFWLLPAQGGQMLAAAMHVNMWDEGIEPLKARVEAGGVVEEDSLR